MRRYQPHRDAPRCEGTNRTRCATMRRDQPHRDDPRCEGTSRIAKATRCSKRDVLHHARIAREATRRIPKALHPAALRRRTLSWRRRPTVALLRRTVRRPPLASRRRPVAPNATRCFAKVPFLAKMTRRIAKAHHAKIPAASRRRPIAREGEPLFATDPVAPKATSRVCKAPYSKRSTRARGAHSRYKRAASWRVAHGDREPRHRGSIARTTSAKLQRVGTSWSRCHSLVERVEGAVSRLSYERGARAESFVSRDGRAGAACSRPRSRLERRSRPSRETMSRSG
jgi:hypothetical protein